MRYRAHNSVLTKNKCDKHYEMYIYVQNELADKRSAQKRTFNGTLNQYKQKHAPLRCQIQCLQVLTEN